MPKTTLYINSGICKCGCSWKDHHLNLIINRDVIIALKLYYEANHKDHLIEGVNGYPLYVPGECEHFGFNEVGGKKYDESSGEWQDHCYRYEDKDGPLGEVEYPTPTRQ